MSPQFLEYIYIYSYKRLRKKKSKTEYIFSLLPFILNDIKEMKKK
jgi:hypothetical protein